MCKIIDTFNKIVHVNVFNLIIIKIIIKLGGFEFFEL
jgi:hypothetical protein